VYITYFVGSKATGAWS